jgi:hypothetical protein
VTPLSLPPLFSLTIFDGIPPQEEGEDPTVFYYYSVRSTSRDTQFNDAGLYLTFLGFCRDFRPSHDCEYFQTDMFLTTISVIQESVYAAAVYDIQSPSALKSPRILMESMRLFCDVYKMFANPDVDEIRKVLVQWPIMTRIAPSFDLFNFSESVLAECQQQIGGLHSAAFFFQGHLFHSSMEVGDASALYVAYRARVGAFGKVSLQSAETGTPSLFQLPSVFLGSEWVFPVIVIYGELVVIFTFVSCPDTIDKSGFAAADGKLVHLLKTILQCNQDTSRPRQRNANAEYCRITGPTVLTKPLKLGEPSVIDPSLSMIAGISTDFASVAVETGQGSKEWLFIDHDGPITTLVTVNSGQDLTLGDTVAFCLQQLQTENLS